MGAIPWSSLLPFASQAPPDFVLLSLLLAILVLSCCYYYYFVKGAAYNYGGRQLPPGSLGLPLGIGENLHYVFGMNCPLGTPRPFLSYRLHKYGKIFKTHLMGSPIVISMDADFNKLLLSNERKLVEASYPDFMKKVIGPFADLHGEHHHLIQELARAVLIIPAIQALHFIPLQEYTKNFFNSWASTGVLDAQKQSKKFVFHYILKFLLRLEPDDPRTLSLMNDYQLLLRFQSSLPLDLPGTAFNQSLKARKRIITTIGEILDVQAKIIREAPKDFLDVILKEVKKYDTPFTDQDRIEIVNGFVIASLDTTSALLTSIFKFLYENPHVTNELQKENASIRENKKEDELLTWDDFKRMQFTRQVIKETLRMATIVEFVAREALQDIVYKGMVIPKGWRILVNFSMLHLNSTFYENPLKFDPWRWQEPKTSSQAFFMPFSGGLRTCIGSQFAEVEVAIFIHYLMTKYKWHVQLDRGEKLDELSGHFAPKMRKGLPIKLEPL